MATEGTTMTKHYKVLVDGKSCHGGKLQWNLPTEAAECGTPAAMHPERWIPGEWHRLDRTVQPGDVCRRGFHLTTDPMQWPKVGMQVYDAEGEGPSDTGGDKTAFTAARLLRPSAYEIPEYWRRVERFVTEEIPAVRWLQPDGNPDPSWHLSVAPARDAAWAAARDAAGAAAWAAARAAAGAAARAAARDAAWAAARDAAWAAARAAAGAAARAAARDAAGAAARDAAWAAARDAAGAAARAAARDAAGAAARDAAWAAARDAAGAAARDAAWAAARDAAWAAARDAARAAARDADLYAHMECICFDLDIDQKHRDHIRARWNVWQKGYALYGDVDGVLYVYAATVSGDN